MVWASRFFKVNFKDKVLIKHSMSDNVFNTALPCLKGINRDSEVTFMYFFFFFKGFTKHLLSFI